MVQPWFGPWPVWMPLTWESCRWNPNVDWLVFTDEERTRDMPENVRYYHMSLADFYAELFSGLGMEPKTTWPKAYKLCDFKVTYGAGLRPRLEDYDFWGMCDLDLIWGNIRTFFPDALLSKFDVLTSERCCTNGQCTLFRNEPLVNDFFRTIPGVERLLHDDVHHGLDELFLNDALQGAEGHGSIKTLRRRLNVHGTWNAWDDWSEQVEKKEAGSLQGLPRLIGACQWRAGRVFHRESGSEMLFYHFGDQKKRLTRHARFYPFWPDCMSGMDLEPGCIKMIFRPGHLFARFGYYFAFRFAARCRYWLTHPVRDTMDLVKGKFPQLVPLYQRIRGFEITS